MLSVPGSSRLTPASSIVSPSGVSVHGDALSSWLEARAGGRRNQTCVRACLDFSGPDVIDIVQTFDEQVFDSGNEQGREAAGSGQGGTDERDDSRRGTDRHGASCLLYTSPSPRD